MSCPAVLKEKGLHRHVLGFLRDNRGEKFTVEEIAERTGHSVRGVKYVLRGALNRPTYKVQRERKTSGADQTLKYWISDPLAALGDGDEARRISTWLLARGKAEVPSVIAKALGLEVRAVATELRHAADVGLVVRCELLLRSGLDRYEYRMAQSAHMGRRVKAPFSERFL